MKKKILFYNIIEFTLLSVYYYVQFAQICYCKRTSRFNLLRMYQTAHLCDLLLGGVRKLLRLENAN